ncbi:MAG TPA: hypothetical protein PLO93_04570 [Candidatus Omnitrophota bacterium]|nr:hypothetical protein [Candidatus Omnitrophota bacterium]HQL41552.1 hypothetical protein [Candidatus Omnitrophota bacterium]
MKKLGIILLVLGAAVLAQAQAFAETEEVILEDTILKLEQIYSGQIGYYGGSGFIYPTPGMSCPKNVCWQGQMLSSLNDPGSSNQDLIDVLRFTNPENCPNDLSIDTEGNGDVRFRCRRQGANPADVWCFAYRCEQTSPAGCKQLWRLRFKVKLYPPWPPISSLDCFDIQNTGVCDDAPSTIQIWMSSCY